MTKLQEELQREEEEYEREEAELQRLDEQGNSWVYFIIVLWADYLEVYAFWFWLNMILVAWKMGYHYWVPFTCNFLANIF